MQYFLNHLSQHDPEKKYVDLEKWGKELGDEKVRQGCVASGRCLTCVCRVHVPSWHTSSHPPCGATLAQQLISSFHPPY